MHPKRFQNQTVLVTGASRGIGAAIAKAFASEGACVLVNYLVNVKVAQEVVSDCEKLGGTALALQADVRDPSAVQDMVAHAMREIGRIDVLVNNAFSPYAFDPENRKRFWKRHGLTTKPNLMAQFRPLTTFVSQSFRICVNAQKAASSIW